MKGKLIIIRDIILCNIWWIVLFGFFALVWRATNFNIGALIIILIAITISTIHLLVCNKRLIEEYRVYRHFMNFKSLEEGYEKIKMATSMIMLFTEKGDILYSVRCRDLFLEPILQKLYQIAKEIENEN